MYRLFAATLTVSALLLFCVQPLIAKMILPLLGGAPAVWNTCMVFFQAALLGGYLYAHLLTTRLAPRAQVAVHVGLLLTALLALPLVVVDAAGAPRLPLAPDAEPVLWLLQLLALTVGLPFFVVAASAPLLQKWFAGTSDPAAGDPYFLYIASNIGSMVALLGYPLLIEPLLGLPAQSGSWLAGYLLLIALTAACGVLALRGARATPTAGDALPEVVETLSWQRRLHWLALAFVPSALMLAVTSYITTDVASMPLLWVVPLALYLLSFIVAFSQAAVLLPDLIWRALPLLTLFVLFLYMTSIALLTWHMMLFHWLVLFIVALGCHGELARDRPAPARLTEFYLWLSLGGVLGGMFTALLAPVLFRTGIIEYPLLLIAACALRPGPGLWQSPSLQRWLDLLVPLGVGALGLGLLLLARDFKGLGPMTRLALVLALLMFLCFLTMDRPTRFAFSTAAMFFAASSVVDSNVRTLLAERNFFGVVRVQDDRRNGFRHLTHGSTLHGLQRLEEDGSLAPPEPLSYYTPSGPIGDVFDHFNPASAAGGVAPRVAVAGLGVGGLSAYAKPHQEWIFYEIDPAIQRVASPEAGYFSFLAKSQAKGGPKVILGDARLRLQELPDHSQGLILLDAFSSDSVPTHLMTREALALYLSKLAPGGILVFNISNRYLDLKPLLANLARNSEPPLVCYQREDGISEEDSAKGKTASQWVILARSDADLRAIVKKPGWEQLEGKPGGSIWTDDFSNLLGVLHWR